MADGDHMVSVIATQCVPAASDSRQHAGFTLEFVLSNLAKHFFLRAGMELKLRSLRCCNDCKPCDTSCINYVPLLSGNWQVRTKAAERPSDVGLAWC